MSLIKNMILNLIKSFLFTNLKNASFLILFKYMLEKNIIPIKKKYILKEMNNGVIMIYKDIIAKLANLINRIFLFLIE